MSTEPLYLRADEIKPGDRLPDVSRFPVSAVKHCPMPTGGAFMHINFDGTAFTRRAFDGGPGYGFECFRVERPADFDPAPDGWDDYALVCDAMHAADACDHFLSSDVGTEPDGSTIVECEACGHRWNEGVS